MRAGETRRPRCVVFGEDPSARELAPRTLRALAATGFSPVDLSADPLSRLGSLLPRGPLWLVRAGAWPVRATASVLEPFPPPTTNGLPLCALGAVVTVPQEPVDAKAQAWTALLQATGGDLNRALERSPAPELPPLASVYLDTVLAERVGAYCARGASLREALQRVWSLGVRAVRYAPLDVHDGARLRVAQVVTSLQRGGAERLVLELASELPRSGVCSRVYSIYSPTRGAFEMPESALDLARIVPARATREQRFLRLRQELAAWGTDLVHAHLLDSADLARLNAGGFRALVTVHNSRAGFPAGLGALDASQAALLVGCARAVESDLREEGLPIPLRTVWNGIRVASPSPRGASDWRSRLGIGSDALVLLSLANPRPQKRLHSLPAILAVTSAATERQVHLLVAGEASAHSEPAQRSLQELRLEIERLGVGDRVHLLGAVEDAPAVLAAADILVSPSEHEGLSLAHLEALGANVPVVASGDGGTRELAAEFPNLRHLPLAAEPRAFAKAILELVTAASPAPTAIVRDFSVPRMTAQYARLYPRALARNVRQSPGDGILLVTNNFSLGGAQSSARRLLLGLRAAGISARAAVIEEQPQYPTPGRSALLEAGVPVLAVPPPQELEPARAVARLFAAIDEDPPEAVLLWNVIAEHKLLLADGLLDIPLFDVSPGEMYFASLERYFAQTPRPGLPYREPRHYGARLRGVIVKYAGEAELARRLLGCPVHVIPNGVDVSSAPPSRSPHSNPLFRLGTAIRIHPDKRVGELLDAVRRAAPQLPPYVLRIAGGVERGAEAYAAELRRAYADLNVDWVGELADSRDFLDTLDVFALVAEPAGCPNASLEAMARGLPVVATDVGGMREQLVPDVTGKLVPRGDRQAFAGALIELGRNAEQRVALGRSAFHRAQEHFSLERMVADYRSACLAPSVELPRVTEELRIEMTDVASA